MDPNNIPENIKRIIGDKNLTLTQKMVAFMAFMPNLPDNNSDVYQDNLDVGKQIKTLIDENKISFGKFDDEFKLHVECTLHDEK